MTDEAALHGERSARIFAEWVGIEAAGFIGGACIAGLAQATLYGEETHQLADLTSEIGDINGTIAGDQAALGTLKNHGQGDSPAAQALRDHLTGQQTARTALEAQRQPLSEQSNDIMMVGVAAGLVVATVVQTGRIGVRRVRQWWQTRQTTTG